MNIQRLFVLTFLVSGIALPTFCMQDIHVVKAQGIDSVVEPLEVSGNQTVEVARDTTVQRTDAQKIKLFGGAFLRGVARGTLTGFGATFNTNRETGYIGNTDAFTDMILDSGHLRLLAEKMMGTFEETQHTILIEEISAAMVHALIPLISQCRYQNYYIARRNHPWKMGLGQAFIVCIDRLVAGLDVRKAPMVRKIGMLVARAITESINVNSLTAYTHSAYISTQEDFFQVFRPLVGLAAVARTLIIDKIIDHREAAGKLQNVYEVNRMRRLLNGTLGFGLSIGANILTHTLNAWIFKKWYPKSKYNDEERFEAAIPDPSWPTKVGNSLITSPLIRFNETDNPGISRPSKAFYYKPDKTDANKIRFRETSFAYDEEDGVWMKQNFNSPSEFLFCADKFDSSGSPVHLTEEELNALYADPVISRFLIER